MLARRTHLKALGAALWAGPGALLERRPRPRRRRPADRPPRPVDLLRGRVRDAGDRRLRRRRARTAASAGAVLALEVDGDVGRWLWLTGSRSGAIAAMELWDTDAWHALVTRHVRVAREAGALVLLQFGLQFRRRAARARAGTSRRRSLAIEEVRAIADATGTPPVVYTAMLLPAWQGRKR